MKTSLIFNIVILALFISCKKVPELPLEEHLQQVLVKGIRKYDIHGVSAAIIRSDNSIWTGTSGVSHDTVSIKPDMVFAIGSITKNVMAALTLKLVEEHMFSLEDPLSKWLPSYTHVNGAITIRQLLNHTSGLYMFWDNQKLWDELKADPAKFWTPEEVLSYLKEPYFEPEDGWHYSNTNYLLLAMILNKITDSNLSTQFKKYFWKPLGIDNVYLSQEEQILETQAHVYGDNFQFGGKEIDVTFLPRASHESITYGSSGIFTTAKDLANWCHALFEGDVLQKQLMEEMQQFVEFKPVGNMIAYGLGVQVFKKRFAHGKEAIGHGGGNIGTSTYMVYLPEFHVSLVVMINAYPNEGIDFIAKGLIKKILIDRNVLGFIPYFDFFPIGLFIACTFVSLFMIIRLRNRKRQKLIKVRV